MSYLFPGCMLLIEQMMVGRQAAVVEKVTELRDLQTKVDKVLCRDKTPT